jgi:hypothetical protein
MNYLRSILFTIFLTAVLAAGVHAQANSLKQISFLLDHYDVFNSDVRLIGDNIDVRAKFDHQRAPHACSPCEPLIFISPVPYILSDSIIDASGTIDGIFYSNLYVYHNLTYGTTISYNKVPKGWAKTLRKTYPVYLRGNIGIWRTPEEVGDNSRALYLHNGEEFNGTAKLQLRWRYINGLEKRLFYDKHFELNFVYANN